MSLHGEPGKTTHVRRERIAGRIRAIYGIEDLFDWQCEVCNAILERKDCILSVPTGGGKTLAFYLPLFAHWKPGDTEPAHQKLILIVSPLVELMKEQASELNRHAIPAVVMCAETLSQGDVLQDFGNGNFRVGFVSPEIAKRGDFHSKVTGRPALAQNLLHVAFDEAHTILEWGGSFQPDYRDAGGILRGRLPARILVLAASATVAPLLVEDLQETLKIRESAVRIEFSNARPNIALSVRPILLPEDSFADLLFMLPAEVEEPADIVPTLVYFNDKVEAELTSDALRHHLPPGIPAAAVAFYHREIGSKRKEEIQSGLQGGSMRVVMTTEALGLGMNIRTIRRVALWKLPPTFAALVQRAGWIRDLVQEGEMILFVEKAQLKGKDALTLDTHNNNGCGGGVEEEPAPPEGPMVEPTLEGRVEVVSQDPEGSRSNYYKTRRNPMAARDRKYLSMFVLQKKCRCIPWNEYYENQSKRPAATVILPSGLRCCDNCHPGRFPIPHIVLQDPHKRQGGRRRKAPLDQAEAVVAKLRSWREAIVREHWPAGYLVLPEHVLPDKLMDSVAQAGEAITSLEDLGARCRWAYAEQFGPSLILALKDAYAQLEAEGEPPPKRGDWNTGTQNSRHSQGQDIRSTDVLTLMCRAFNDIFHAIKNLRDGA